MYMAQLTIFFFKKCLFELRVTERKGEIDTERSLICGFPPRCHNSQAGVGSSPTWVARTPNLGSSSSALPRHVSGGLDQEWNSQNFNWCLYGMLMHSTLYHHVSSTYSQSRMAIVTPVFRTLSVTALCPPHDHVPPAPVHTCLCQP